MLMICSELGFPVIRHHMVRDLRAQSGMWILRRKFKLCLAMEETAGR